MEEGRLPRREDDEFGQLEEVVWAEMDRAHLMTARLSYADREFLFRGSASKDIILATNLFHRIMEPDFESPAYIDAPAEDKQVLASDPTANEDGTLLVWFRRLVETGFKAEHLRTMEKAQAISCLLVQVTTPELSSGWSHERTADLLFFLKLAHGLICPSEREGSEPTQKSQLDIQASWNVQVALWGLEALKKDAQPFPEYLRRLEALSGQLTCATAQLARSYAKAVGAPAGPPTGAEIEKLDAYQLSKVRKLDNAAVQRFLGLAGNRRDATKSTRSRLNEVEEMLRRVGKLLEVMGDHWAPLTSQLTQEPH